LPKSTARLQRTEIAADGKDEVSTSIVAPHLLPSPLHPVAALAASRGSGRDAARTFDELATLIHDAIDSQRGLELELSIGRAVAEMLYDGDPSTWRLRSPKRVSLRRMVEDAELAITPAALCRALGVYEVWSVAARGRPWHKLSASHYRAVLDVPVEEQRALLEEAWREHLPADELRRRAKVEGQRRSARGGRLPTHPVARMVERVEREVALLGRRASGLRLHELKQARSDALALRCDRLAVRLQDLGRRLRQR
jgi:hypothetical protein